MKKSILALAILAASSIASAQFSQSSGFIADVGGSSSANAQSGGNGRALSSSGQFQSATVGSGSSGLQTSFLGAASTSGMTQTTSGGYSANITQGNAIAEGGSRGGALAEVGTAAGYTYLNGTFGEVRGSSVSESSIQVGGGAYQGGGAAINGALVSNTGAYNSTVVTTQLPGRSASSLTNSVATNESTKFGGAVNLGNATGGQTANNFGSTFTTATGTGQVRTLPSAR